MPNSLNNIVSIVKLRALELHFHNQLCFERNLFYSEFHFALQKMSVVVPLNAKNLFLNLTTAKKAIGGMNRFYVLTMLT